MGLVCYGWGLELWADGAELQPDVVARALLVLELGC